MGKKVIYDVDVVGGINIKNYYKEQAISIFIKPHGIEILRKRLESRGTDSKEAINTRIDKAEFELSLATQCDKIVVNDELEDAQHEVYELLRAFINE